MKDSTRKSIEAVIKTLDSVAVSGKNNLDMQLGCILTLEKVLREEDSDAVLDSDGNTGA